MIVDFDDFHALNHRLDYLHRLKEANPAFRATLFAVPAHGSEAFWDAVPEWLELAVHGWHHGGPDNSDPREAENWTYSRTVEVLWNKPARFVNGFKAPGWQISDATYQALLDQGWWLADQPYNDERRPKGLQVHRLGDGDHWHGHIQNVCGNGVEENFGQLLDRVKHAESFQFVSEAVTAWE